MNNCSMCAKWETESDLRVAELECCRLMLNRDQYFPGYSFLFTRQHVTELFLLDKDLRATLMEEISLVAAALYTIYKPDKMNYELIGNMVPHIHWHIVPRFRTDPLWPRTVWAEPHDEKHLSERAYAETIERICTQLNLKEVP
jgi:diadenosine tetraphosphate (Ap4A) HIT family hydrolase